MMEALAFYLIKSVAWLTGFSLVYLLFLRNESYFNLNRVFLFAGIISALLLPLFTFTYTVPVEDSLAGAYQGSVHPAAVTVPVREVGFDILSLLAVVYLAGAVIVAFASARQGRTIVREIRKTGFVAVDPVRVIRSGEYESAFSFFSWVFINPSINETEMREIMNHELVHVRDRHSIDLLLSELLCIIQWFNPMSWFYVRLIRQNHEYIADRAALQSSSDPALYRAALLNQLVGAPVISLGNSFSYSLNKKRFKMMETIISPPYRKLRLLFILPVFAVLFYAFARPEYRYASQPGTQNAGPAGQQEKGVTVTGKIVKKNGEPLSGANIVVLNTYTGTTSDENGNFTLAGIANDAALVISFVGFKSKVIKQEFVSGSPIVMEKDTIRYLGGSAVLPPPPPPPPPPSDRKVSKTEAKDIVVTGYAANGNGTPPPPPPPPPPSPAGKAGGQGMTIKGSPAPLVIVDGIEHKGGLDDIDPATIESVNVLKEKSATDKYGEKGRDGVVELVTKSKESVYVVVEELPEFPGGNPGIQAYLRDNVKIPAGFSSKSGTVAEVLLVVDKSGKPGSASMVKPVNPRLDREIVNAINRMPDWKPGVQNGKAVDTQLIIPFELK